MIIRNRSIEDFLTVLAKHEIFNKTIHYDRTKVEKSEATDEIIFQVSAVIVYPNTDQALVQAAEVCGLDRHSEGEAEGSNRQAELVGVLKAFRSDVVLLPGMIDLG